jgi:hypothetical protein
VIPSPSIYACLGVYGSFAPADLNGLVGVAAKTGRAGERSVRQPDRPGPDHDWWHYSTDAADSYDWAAQLDRLIALIDPVMQRFISYCDDHRLDCQVHLVASVPEGASTPIGTVAASQVAWMAAIGASLDIDVTL